MADSITTEWPGERVEAYHAESGTVHVFRPVGHEPDFVDGEIVEPTMAEWLTQMGKASEGLDLPRPAHQFDHDSVVYGLEGARPMTPADVEAHRRTLTGQRTYSERTLAALDARFPAGS